jgi:Xaa-Pro aminopeptidase
MDRDQLAAVVARSGQNLTYLSGVWYSWQLGSFARILDLTDQPRGVLLFWPREGEPVMVVNSMVASLTTEGVHGEGDSYVKRVSIYEAYNESPYHRLCKAIKEAGLGRERIGFEKNYVSATHWEEIQRELPSLEMVDCARMMDEVRWIKTPSEIELIKKGADLLDDAFVEVFPTIRPGVTEREAHARMVSACLRRGANWTYGVLHSSSNANQFFEGHVEFRQGEAVRTDFITWLNNYPGHQSRNAVLGKPNAQMHDDYASYRDIYLTLIERCRPGARTGKIYDDIVAECKKRGWTSEGVVMGHSVGAWWHQQEPYIAPHQNSHLEEGMVIAVELFGIKPNRGWLHIQDMVLIRSNGPDLISSKLSTDKMFVID